MDSAGDLRGEDGMGVCRVLHNTTTARRCDALLDTPHGRATCNTFWVTENRSLGSTSDFMHNVACDTD